MTAFKSIKTVKVIPRVSGYIEARYFEEGTVVNEGDPLYLEWEGRRRSALGDVQGIVLEQAKFIASFFFVPVVIGLNWKRGNAPGACLLLYTPRIGEAARARLLAAMEGTS